MCLCLKVGDQGRWPSRSQWGCNAQAWPGCKQETDHCKYVEREGELGLGWIWAKGIGALSFKVNSSIERCCIYLLTMQ